MRKNRLFKISQIKRSIQKNKAFLSSQKDSEIFFNSIVNASEPNADLVAAARRHKEL